MATWPTATARTNRDDPHDDAGTCRRRNAGADFRSRWGSSGESRFNVEPPSTGMPRASTTRHVDVRVKRLFPTFLKPKKPTPISVPLPADFDEAYYLAAYPDVRDAVSAGTFPQGAVHYQHFGQGEGRAYRPAEIVVETAAMADPPTSRVTEARSPTTGLPYPSPELIFLVTHGRDPVVFEATGAADLNWVRRAVREAGLVLPGKGLKVLDWGCGCGRLARHWLNEAADVELFGCDINAGLVAWCKNNLSFGVFTVSSVKPPLKYDDGTFDLLYGISVLTHLTLDENYEWMREIHRVLASDGVAVLTIHGPTMFAHFLPGASAIQGTHPGKLRTHLIDEEVFACIEQEPGSNQSANVLTGSVFEKIFHPFDVRLHRPRYGLMGIHDTCVITKKSGRPLTFIEHLTVKTLRGTKDECTCEIHLTGQSSFSILADLKGLYASATIRLSLKLPGNVESVAESRIVDLPPRADWTILDKAYSMITLDDIPSHHGPALLSIEVCGESLDGVVLTLSKGMLF